MLAACCIRIRALEHVRIPLRVSVRCLLPPARNSAARGRAQRAPSDLLASFFGSIFLGSVCFTVFRPWSDFISFRTSQTHSLLFPTTVIIWSHLRPPFRNLHVFWVSISKSYARGSFLVRFLFFFLTPKDTCTHPY